MDIQQAERLRVLWKSGEDKFRSFFAVMNEVRLEIGDEALAIWCRTELFISLEIIIDMAKAFNKAGASMVKSELDEARKIEKQKRETERAEIQARKAAADRQRIDEELAKAKKQDEIEAIKVKTDRKAKLRKTWAEKSAEKKKEENIKRYARFKAQKEREHNGPIISVDLEDVAMRLRNGHNLAESGTANWIDGSIQAAMALTEGRQAFPSNLLFSEWLKKSGLDFYSDHERAALINLGSNSSKMREVLSQTQSRSYQLIWQSSKNGYPSCEDSQEGNIIPLRTA